MKRKEFFSNGIAVILAAAGVWGAYTAVLTHDKKVLGSGQFQQSPVHIEQPAGISDDERRISAMFAADTLPGLIQTGLVKKFEHTDVGTIVTVSGNLWKPRSEFFKYSLLTAIRVYNTVHGYEERTQIMDAATGAVYAEIFPSSVMKCYD